MELPSSGLTDTRALVHVAIDNDPLRSLTFIQKRHAPDILASWTLDPSGDFIVGAFARIPSLDVLLPSNVRSTRGPLNLFGGSQTSLSGGVPGTFPDILKRSDSGDSKCEHLFDITKGAIGVMRSWGRIIRKDRYAKEAA